MMRLPDLRWTRDYLTLRFALGGRERPAVDCWGLYRLIVGEQLGVWLPGFEAVSNRSVTAHAFVREARRAHAQEDGAAGRWDPIEPGSERPFDLVLLNGVLGTGREAVALPAHVGVVVDDGLMLDIEETTGVMLRAFRSTARRTVLPTVVNRVLGIYRSAEIGGAA